VVHLNADISAASDEQMRGPEQINTEMSLLARERTANVVQSKQM